MDETLEADPLADLDAASRELQDASVGLLRSGYGSLETWGATRYLRLLLRDVEVAAAELGRTCEALVMVPGGPWVRATRPVLYQARCRLEEGRWGLDVYARDLPRRGSKSPSAAVAMASSAIGEVARELAGARASAPAESLSVRDAGRVVSVAARIVNDLETVMFAASRVRVPGYEQPPAGGRLSSVGERLADARLALTRANADLGRFVVNGVERVAPVPLDVAAIRTLLTDVRGAAPDFEVVTVADLSSWLSGRQGPDRIRELADALRSLETMVTCLQRGVAERWGAIGSGNLRKAADLLAGGANLFGVAGRESSEFTAAADELPGALLLWAQAVHALAVTGERGVGITVEDAAAHLSASEVRALFETVAGVVRTIAPMVAMIGGFGAVTGVALLGERPMARLTMELEEAWRRLDAHAVRVGRAGGSRRKRRLEEGGDRG